MHETYAGNIHDSTEFPELIEGIINYLTDLKINTEDITLVFDKGNNSTDNIGKFISKMSFVASAKFDQAEDLLDIPLEDFKHIYTNSKDHEIYGSRTKYTFFGKEFTTITTYNKATYTLQKESYLSSKAKILAKLTDLKRRLESDRGKERDKSSVEREISDIIVKDFRSIIGYEVSDIPKGKKKPKIKFWTRIQTKRNVKRALGN